MNLQILVYCGGIYCGETVNWENEFSASRQSIRCDCRLMSGRAPFFWSTFLMKWTNYIIFFFFTLCNIPILHTLCILEMAILLLLHGPSLQPFDALWKFSHLSKVSSRSKLWSNLYQIYLPYAGSISQKLWWCAFLSQQIFRYNYLKHAFLFFPLYFSGGGLIHDSNKIKLYFKHIPSQLEVERQCLIETDFLCLFL